MRHPSLAGLAFAILSASTLSARTVVFWEDGFPSIDTAPVARQALEKALQGDEVTFAGVDVLANSETLTNAGLLVLPYGSAIPADAFAAIEMYVHRGGNLLVIGGQPFRVPVTRSNGIFTRGLPTNAYAHEIGIVHTYEAPQKDEQTFSWSTNHSFLPAAKIQARRYFVLEGRVDGLGYMLNAAGDRVAAPVVASDHIDAHDGGMLGSRFVFLDFDPVEGYWESPDGASLLRTAAEYSRQSIAEFSTEMQFSTVKPGQHPEMLVHLRSFPKQPQGASEHGLATVELLSASSVIQKLEIPCTGAVSDTGVQFSDKLNPGFYAVKTAYAENNRVRASYRNGFWVESREQLESGYALGVKGDFLTNGDKPFFPFGTNYFTTEEDGWDFSGPRNAAVWESDFTEMEKHGVSFVRTGVWGGQIKFLNEPSGGVSERFLRNVEAFLLSAHRHNIAVNFTFFAFDPQTTLRLHGDNPVTFLPGGNPYLDPVTIRAEQDYMLSIVERFKNVPYLCWDLINEPSFSNPHHLWHGNTPNDDPAELDAWHKWLAHKYESVEKLASVWAVTPGQLKTFEAIPLPGAHDLTFDLEGGNTGQLRAYDYNLFAQEMFSNWVRSMVDAIRATGSRQLIDVGQDEGGVQNRVLNQFYGNAGLSFTTNHTYRENSALLWDSLAAKLPGVPNIVGETGYQPVILPNGQWHFDEITGASLIERKWIQGFAGGTSGALSWDWAREIYFGIKRSDGSNKVWEDMMRDMGNFVRQASAYATEFTRPEVAIVLPQSLQLSTLSNLALEAQRICVRALYGYARSQAYVVGEDQIQHIGDPKLIILPSPWTLSEQAWQAIVGKVNGGATLLLSGRFDEDPHFEATERARQIGIDYRPGLLQVMREQIQWPEGSGWLTYLGAKTDYLERALLPDGSSFVERSLGKGKILFVPLPLELNDNLRTVGDIYKYALKQANVSRIYSSDLDDPGILICPTHFPNATLYTVTSESGNPQISFRDERSGKEFSGHLEPGRGALLLIGERGDLLASYNWPAQDRNEGTARR
jgi:Beta-galactosidase